VVCFFDRNFIPDLKEGSRHRQAKQSKAAGSVSVTLQLCSQHTATAARTALLPASAASAGDDDEPSTVGRRPGAANPEALRSGRRAGPHREPRAGQSRRRKKKDSGNPVWAGQRLVQSCSLCSRARPRTPFSSSV
jgi:hypothetical protein